MAVVVLKDGTRVHTGMIRGPTGIKGQTVTVRPIKGGTMTEVRTSLGGGSSRRSVTRTRPGQVVVTTPEGYIRKETDAERQLRRLEEIDPKRALAQRQAIQRQKQEQVKTKQLASLAQKDFSKRVESENLGPGTYREIRDGREFFFTVDTDRSLATQAQLAKATRTTTSSGPVMSLEQKGVIETKLYQSERQKKNIFGRVFDDLTAASDRQKKVVAKGGLPAVGSVLVALPLLSVASLGVGAAAVVTQPKRSYAKGKEIVNFAISNPKTFFKSVGKELLVSGVTNPIGTTLEFYLGGKGLTVAMKTAYKGGKAVAVATGKITKPVLNKLRKGQTVKVPMTVKTVEKVGQKRVTKTKTKDVQMKLDAKGMKKLNKRLETRKVKTMMTSAKAEKPARVAYNNITDKLSSIGLSQKFPNYSTFQRYSLSYRIGLLQKYNRLLTKKKLSELRKTKAVRDYVQNVEATLKTQRVKRGRKFKQKQIKVRAKKERVGRYEPATYQLLASSLFEGRSSLLNRKAFRASLKKAKERGDWDSINRLAYQAAKEDARRALLREKGGRLYMGSPEQIAITQVLEKTVDAVRSPSNKVRLTKLQVQARNLRIKAKTRISSSLSQMRKSVSAYRRSPTIKNRVNVRKVFKTHIPYVFGGLVTLRYAAAVDKAVIHAAKIASGQVKVPVIDSKTSQTQTPVQSTSFGSAVPGVAALLTGVTGKTLTRYFKNPPAQANMRGPQTGQGLGNLPIAFKARFSTITRFNYLPDLESILYGVRATEGEKRALKSIGRIFSGMESRKIV